MEIKRRAFLSKLGAAGVGVGVAGLSGCNSSGGSSGQNTGRPLETYSASGSYAYDASARTLSLTVTDSTFPANCKPQANDPDSVFTVRGVMSDAMYWLIEGGDRDRLLQWLRNPAVDGEILGAWSNAYGYTLTLLSGDRFELAFSGFGCSSYGLVGVDALVDNPFQQGVASGEPSARGFIIWTRDDKALNSAVQWQVATDPLFKQVVKSGESTPSAADDYTIKETVTGLIANSRYYYRFSTGKDSEGAPYYSQVGRIQTLPAQTESVQQLKFAVVSCSSYPHGYFVGYRNVSRRDDLDYVLHLGDYIYEYEETAYGNQAAIDQGRIYAEGNRQEILTLADYRARYKHYREDTDLQMLHTRYGFITTWDDHETADNSWDPDGSGPEGGAVNHNEGEGEWNLRKSCGAQAYNEWIPITDIEDYFNPEIHRSFVFGTLMELLMLDTRIQGRAKQPDIAADSFDDPDRRMISLAQESWLTGRLGNVSNTNPRTWKVLGQQVMMAPVQAPPILAEQPSNPPSGPVSPEWANVLNTDGWDGYAANRQTIWDHIGTNNIENVVVLTGDIHTSWAMELQQPVLLNASQINALSGLDQLGVLPEVGLEGPKYGVEFVTPSITSPGLEEQIPIDIGVTAAEQAVQLYNPHIKYADLSHRGYVVLEVTPQQMTASWYHLDTILNKNNDGESLAAQFAVQPGSNVLIDSTS